MTVSAILYNSSPAFHEDLRFGFEGFFNWIETGSFTTVSTTELQTMWIWPTTPQGWIIGEGRVGVFETGSDIGYCNYILYCGLISAGLGYTLQMIGQKYTEPTKASLIMSLEAVFAVIAGALLLRERMSPRELLGCAVMFAAIVLVQLPGKKADG